MFEQSIYDTEPAAEPLHKGDLFYHYEIKNWDLSPRLYKILAFSAITNILAILIVGQTSLLTMKGCDSPLVGRVCQVLDTVYVSSMLFGTDREYVDVAYEKTALGDADITFVDVTGETPQLSYPEGYFQIANPNEYAMLQQQANNPADGYIAPGIPLTNPSTGGSLLDTQPVLPKANPNVVDGDLPTFGDATPTVSGRKGRRGGRVTPDANATASTTPKPTPSP